MEVRDQTLGSEIFWFYWISVRECLYHRQFLDIEWLAEVRCQPLRKKQRRLEEVLASYRPHSREWAFKITFHLTDGVGNNPMSNWNVVSSNIFKLIQNSEEGTINKYYLLGLCSWLLFTAGSERGSMM